MKLTSRISVIWPPQAVVTESLFRHFSGIAEVASYLRDISPVVKELNLQIVVHDCSMVPYTAMNMAQIVYNSDLLCIFVNMNNIVESLNAARFFKSVEKDKKILAYGEAICCNPQYFSSLGLFDYVVSNGQFELGIEVGICEVYGFAVDSIQTIINYNSYYISDGIICFNKDIVLPPEKWGVPQFDMLPLDSYLRISNGEVHITACKGCPFGCEFCNEKYVSSQRLRYREITQIVDYLCYPQSSKVTSVYLDASTFSYDREWVIDLCQRLINEKKTILPWKTCTRLDCIDDELIELMGKANCTRISIGVESMDFDIQKRNNKVIKLEKLERFSELCHKHGIQPRALLIIGLKGQTVEEINYTKTYLAEIGVDARFRVLQNFDFMLSGENIDESMFEKLDRWIVNTPLENLDINQLRHLEYPPYKNSQNYS